MRRWFALLGLLVGCYSPTVSPGAPCSAEGTCPRGLTCVDGRCELSPPGATDATDPTGDALVIGDSDVVQDGGADAGIDAMAGATWSTPTLVPGLDDVGSEGDPSFTPSRLTVVFERNDDLYLGTRASVTEPFAVTPLTMLSSSDIDKSPEISADGGTIHFVSNRSAAGARRAYSSRRLLGGIWTNPSSVGPLNSIGDLEDLAISPDGLTAVIEHDDGFAISTRTTTLGQWGTPVPIAGVDFGLDPTAPSITSAGDIYFHADPSLGAERDLYVARRNSGGYDQPVAITELATSAREASPFVSGDGTHMMFERAGKIYESTR